MGGLIVVGLDTEEDPFAPPTRPAKRPPARISTGWEFGIGRLAISMTRNQATQTVLTDSDLWAPPIPPGDQEP